ncbi:hypothetical protein PXK48_20930, partial [Phaeobacter gallaeciensis]|nr:hypothetical protein [Phaeobacter gallaeciensis]MDE4126635.1 hypothetical protein [Phaeobacter gallaeciensis]MDE4131122.1 hypothetical protein [Phaeobacter gallaeciensis]
LASLRKGSAQPALTAEITPIVGTLLSAINTMVPAHAPFLAGETGWSVASEEMEDGVALIVGGDGEQIQGLGFFGLMTIGVHHQEHHLMIAKGRKPHH